MSRRDRNVGLLSVVAVIAGVVRDAALQRLRGVICPICRDRTRHLVAHVLIDHAEAGGA